MLEQRKNTAFAASENLSTGLLMRSFCILPIDKFILATTSLETMDPTAAWLQCFVGFVESLPSRPEVVPLPPFPVYARQIMSCIVLDMCA